jgi:hypothetical protein
VSKKKLKNNDKKTLPKGSLSGLDAYTSVVVITSAGSCWPRIFLFK